MSEQSSQIKPIYKNIALTSIYLDDLNFQEGVIRHLYHLLEERKPEESISHYEMPDYDTHREFILAKPYKAWYVIQNLNSPDICVVGSIYLNHDDSIGIAIYDKYRKQGYASAAITSLMQEHPADAFYANINPENLKSRELFKKLGFKFYKHLMGHKRMPDGTRNHQIIQTTFRLLIAGNDAGQR